MSCAGCTYILHLDFTSPKGISPSAIDSMSWRLNVSFHELCPDTERMSKGLLNRLQQCHRPSINRNEMNKKKSEVKEKEFTLVDLKSRLYWYILPIFPQIAYSDSCLGTFSIHASTSIRSTAMLTAVDPTRFGIGVLFLGALPRVLTCAKSSSL